MVVMLRTNKDSMGTEEAWIESGTEQFTTNRMILRRCNSTILNKTSCKQNRAECPSMHTYSG